MKLYHFNPNGWGIDYYVMEKDRESALKRLVEFLHKELKSDEKRYKEMGIKVKPNSSELRKWKKADLDVPGTLPDGYTIDEHVAGDVICVEHS